MSKPASETLTFLLYSQPGCRLSEHHSTSYIFFPGVVSVDADDMDDVVSWADAVTTPVADELQGRDLPETCLLSIYSPTKHALYKPKSATPRITSWTNSEEPLTYQTHIIQA